MQQIFLSTLDYYESWKYKEIVLIIQHPNVMF